MSARVWVGLGQIIRSPAPRVRPDRWQSRSRTVISLVTTGSLISNCGRYFVTGASQATLPSSTSMARAAAVKALVLEATPNRVESVTLSGPPRRRTP